jgi:hypothetical protein
MGEWEVTIRMDGSKGVYKVVADRYYDVKSRALAQFVQEFKIPIKPYQFLTTKKHLVDISTRTLHDRRVGVRDVSPIEFYIQGIEDLRKAILFAESIPEVARNSSAKFLIKAREALNEFAKVADKS